MNKQIGEWELHCLEDKLVSHCVLAEKRCHCGLRVGNGELRIFTWCHSLQTTESPQHPGGTLCGLASGSVPAGLWKQSTSAVLVLWWAGDRCLFALFACRWAVFFFFSPIFFSAIAPPKGIIWRLMTRPADVFARGAVKHAGAPTPPCVVCSWDALTDYTSATHHWRHRLSKLW